MAIEKTVPWRAADEIERLTAALNAAAYALFEIKRMQPEAIKEHAAAAHAKACAVLDGSALEQQLDQKSGQ